MLNGFCSIQIYTNFLFDTHKLCILVFVFPVICIHLNFPSKFSKNTNNAKSEVRFDLNS
jgi:hypothetical protein